MGQHVLDNWLDPGERALKFLGNLTHTGDYAGQPFNLRPWQADPVKQLFGTVYPETGLRQYRKCFFGLPRKQGKTELVAGCGLYALMGQGRSNQLVWLASGDVKQASHLFKAMVTMIRFDPVLSSLVTIYEGKQDRRLVFHQGNSELEVLSSVPKGKHGGGPSVVLIDELHVVDEDLVTVLTTGFAARKDPLTIFLTTAGHDLTSICYDEWQYALGVKNGTITDPEYLPIIYAADPEDDWKDEATWHKAMPALGDFCSIDEIRSKCREAILRPRKENGFKQLYLNLWTEQSTRWLQTERWKECGLLDSADF